MKIPCTCVRGASANSDDKILDLYNPDSEAYEICKLSRRKEKGSWTYVTPAGEPIHLPVNGHCDPERLLVQQGTLRIYPSLAAVKSFAKLSYRDNSELYMVPIYMGTDITQTALADAKQKYPLNDDGFKNAKTDFGK